MAARQVRWSPEAAAGPTRPRTSTTCPLCGEGGLRGGGASCPRWPCAHIWSMLMAGRWHGGHSIRCLDDGKGSICPEQVGFTLGPCPRHLEKVGVLPSSTTGPRTAF